MAKWRKIVNKIYRIYEMKFSSPDGLNATQARHLKDKKNWILRCHHDDKGQRIPVC